MGFKTSRVYWSFRNLNKKCRYICRIDDNEGSPCFVIKVIEDGMKDLVLRDNTAKGNKTNTYYITLKEVLRSLSLLY